MKKRVTILISFIGLIILSCEKNDETTKKRNSKPVSASEQLDIFKNITPDTVVKPYEECTTIGNQVACGSKNGQFDMDVNNDNKMDFRFEASIGTSMSDVGIKSSFVNILDTTFQLLATPILTNEVISNTQAWTNSKLFYLAKSPGGFGVQEDYSLLSDSKFLAFRHLTPPDTLFGWIKVSIQDYNNIKIDAYSMQK